MEKWEKSAREKMNKEIKPGSYKIGPSCYTGKEGFIDFQIALEKKIRKPTAEIEDEILPEIVVEKKKDD